MGLSRRTFLGTGAAAGSLVANQLKGADAPATSSLPTRVLGRTGVHVSALAFGCGSRFLSYQEEDRALEAVGRAYELGVRYFDTAYAYANGLSETRVGKALASKNDVFISTKMQERDGEKVKAIIEGSLKRLRRDRLDLIHIHQLRGEDDLARIEAKDGILNTLLHLRDEKVTRFIGITCHEAPVALKTALERHDFDCVQMALNAALVGMKSGRNAFGGGSMVIDPDLKASFETLALPVAKQKNMGIIAMKVFAADGLVGQVAPEKLLYYAMSLPVSTVSVGMPTLQIIAQNTQLTRDFKPLGPEEMHEMSGRLSAHNKIALDLYLQHHQDSFLPV